MRHKKSNKNVRRIRPRVLLLTLYLFVVLGQAEESGIVDGVQSDQATSSNPSSSSSTRPAVRVSNKIKVKGHMAYHFKKIVREISQELLISRKMDVNPLLVAAQALDETSKVIEKYCDSLKIQPQPPPPRVSVMNMRPYTVPLALGSLATPTTSTPRVGSQSGHSATSPVRSAHQFELVESEPVHDQVVASRICQARGMQLPEIYDSTAANALQNFLKANQLGSCFAGTEPDLASGLQRFRSTGLPVWEGHYAQIYTIGGRLHATRQLMDDYAAAMAYTNEDKLVICNSHHNPVFQKRLEIQPTMKLPGRGNTA